MGTRYTPGVGVAYTNIIYNVVIFILLLYFFQLQRYKTKQN